MSERIYSGRYSLRNPTQRSEFIYRHGLKKQHQESEQASIARRSELSFREIQRKANNPKGSSPKPKHLPLFEVDHLGKMHKVMRSSYYLGDLVRAEHEHRYGRRRSGWGPFKNSTKTKESKKMRKFIRQTGGVTLPYTPRWRWKLLLEDLEINQSIENR